MQGPLALAQGSYAPEAAPINSRIVRIPALALDANGLRSLGFGTDNALPDLYGSPPLT